MTEDRLPIEAAARFTLKHELGEFNIGENELTHAREVLKSQPSKFIETIDSIQPDVANLLLTASKEGFYIWIANNHDENSEFNFPQGVYRMTGKPKQLIGLILAPENINQLSKNFEIILDKFSSKTAARLQIDSAIVALSWLELGLWTVDKLDPEDTTSSVSPQTLHLLARINGLKDKEVDDYIEAGKVEDIEWQIMRYRVGGGMAYIGLKRHYDELLNMGENAPAPIDLNIFRTVTKIQLDKLVERKKMESASAIHFALSNPLYDHEISWVFNSLLLEQR